MSDSVEYMKNQARLALEKGDKQSSAVLTLCAGFLETVEEADSLRTQLAEATRNLEEARKDAERYRYLRDNCSSADEAGLGMIGIDLQFTSLINSSLVGKWPDALDKSIDQAIEQGKGGDDGNNG
jgi:hypothetical protein